MRGYGQFCPVAQTLEILGERWTLLVVRELLSGSHRFNEIARGVPLMSRTMLSRRLESLEECGVLDKRTEDGRPFYALTDAGEELRPIVMAFGEWGQRWAKREPSEEALDGGLLAWDMRRRLDRDALPDRRVVVALRWIGAERGKERFWLIIEPGEEVDLCLSPPGFDVDLVVEAQLLAMTRIWNGDDTVRAAKARGDLTLEGPRSLVRGFPKWLQRSVFADVERP